MHPLLACTLLAMSAIGGGVAGAPADLGGGSGSLVDIDAVSTQQVNTTLTEPTPREGPGYLAGSFFIRFGPALLVIILLAWIFLGRE